MTNNYNSWLASEMTSCHHKLVPTFPWIDNCLMVIKCDFLEIDSHYDYWLNKESQKRSVAEGWLST